MQFYIITYNGSTPGGSGESCKTEYEFDNACDVCGTGAELKENLKVKGISKVKKGFFATLDGDILISKNLYERIKLEIPKLDLKRAINAKNQPLEFYHLDSRVILPKFKDNSTGFVTEDQCPVCYRNGYYNDVIIDESTVVKPLDFKYQDDDFRSISNEIILKTWECRGQSNKAATGKKVIRFARPWIVIRQDLKDILELERIPNIQYQKIKIEGSVQQ